MEESLKKKIALVGVVIVAVIFMVVGYIKSTVGLSNTGRIIKKGVITEDGEYIVDDHHEIEMGTKIDVNPNVTTVLPLTSVVVGKTIGFKAVTQVPVAATLTENGLDAAFAAALASAENATGELQYGYISWNVLNDKIVELVVAAVIVNFSGAVLSVKNAILSSELGPALTGGNAHWDAWRLEA